MSSSNQRIGALFLYGSLFIEGLFPVLAKLGVHAFPPIFFWGSVSSIAAFVLGIYLLYSGLTKELQQPHVWKYILGVSCFTVIVPFSLVFYGTSLTSSINVALIGQAEMLFALLYSFIVFHERLSIYEWMGAGCIFFGTGLVLYNGASTLNTGDIFILLSCMLFPIGNLCAKKVLTYISPLTLLCMRYVVGAPCIIALSFFFESPSVENIYSFAEQWWLVLTVALLVFIGSKVCWYQGIKRISVGKATSILMASPVITVLFAFAVFSEIPTLYQCIGLFVTLFGVYAMTSHVTSHV